ncbi:hypothetical protein E1A91_A08G081500v1 [Gossypium mustelinum]|uniref:Uncharacterized protein n=1 Tax=Gossypium mustelinum TaxID=34275 RepID=A0A5D2Y7D0_GOSMU|nr:hypothetical protein GOBAR_DD21312 [Gossypium barbadense]TYJ21720.1 hypothetical protein E1A91_A08G081500v1 [Gossypium mustelinum]
MQKKGKDLQRVGICQGIFNFIISSLVGFSLKRITLGHPMPRGSTNEAQEPLISQAKLDENPRIDDSGSAVRIHFKQTEEEELEDWNWTHVDKLGSSVHVADKDDGDDEAMEKRNKDIPRLNGVSLDTDEPQQVHGKTGRRVIIPITDSEEYQGKTEQKHQLDGARRILVHEDEFYCFMVQPAGYGVDFLYLLSSTNLE